MVIIIVNEKKLYCFAKTIFQVFSTLFSFLFSPLIFRLRLTAFFSGLNVAIEYHDLHHVTPAEA